MGLVVVSHSHPLAQAAVELAREMLHGQDVAIEVAAGLDDGALGTDANAILAAVTAADRGDGAVVLMDLGSAVLSAELALELLDEPARARVVLCPAPLVEGLVVAAVAAGAGAGRDDVAAEAVASLAGKQSHLSSPEPAAAAPRQDGSQPADSFVVEGVHGLHARPAARLVQRVASLDARVELRNASTGSGWVAATSLSQVATLGALQGHEVQVRASGPNARQAIDALLDAAASSFDHAPGSAPSPAGPAASGTPVPASSGTPVPASPGIGIGPSHLLRLSRRQVRDEPAGDPGPEWERLTAARDRCRAEVARTRAAAALTMGEPEAAVFDAHLLLLDDSDLLADARSRIDAGQAAARSWDAAVDRVHAALAALPDPYQQARAADVRAVGDQVLRQLLGEQGPDEGLTTAAGVLVAADLTPAQASALDPARVVGLVLAFGSPTAHSAILARARGVPAVVGAGPTVLETTDGTLVALDGSTGELVVDPPSDVLARFRLRAGQQEEAGRVALVRADAQARTRDGVEVLVGANIGSVEDARLAASCGADLAGLVRTEFFFLDRDQAPDVEEQEAVYREIAAAMGGRRLTLRTLDVGGDKPLRYLPVPAEANPFLGLRGIRLSLARPGLLADQLLAVVKVAHDTPISVMFPMVATVAELVAARAVLNTAIAALGRGQPAGLQVGIMVEVPAAALKIAAFARQVDFLSIGTNDLTAYALAADRGNSALAGLGDPYDPGVLRLVSTVCAGAHGAPVAVCGELAADERAAPLLVGLGVHELSVTPRAVPAVKMAVRGVHRRQAAETAQLALDADSPDAVRALLDRAGHVP